MGKPILMGRRTFESIDRPLAGRHNLVLSRDSAFRPGDAIVVKDIDEAIAVAGGVRELMVIGGANIYAQLLNVADHMELTEIGQEFEGDVHFPPYDREQWEEVRVEAHAQDAGNPWPYHFVTLQRRKEIA